MIVSAFWYERGVRSAELLRTLEALNKSRMNIFITDDVPVFPFDPFGCKYRKALFLPSKCSMKARVFQQHYASYYPSLLATASKVPGVQLVKSARYFCGKKECRMAQDRQLLYRDNNHLNINGSRFVAAQLLKDYPAIIASIQQHR